MLEGQRIDLRLVSEADLPSLSALGSDTREFTPFQGLHLQPEATVRKRFAEGQYWSEESGWLLIVERKSGRLLGDIGFFKTAAYRGDFEIGYRLHKAADRGKGFMPEALKLLSAYLFAAKPIERLQVCIIAANTPSLRVAEKAGYTFEGTLRRASFVRGVWHDLHVFSMLREEAPSFPAPRYDNAEKAKKPRR